MKAFTLSAAILCACVLVGAQHAATLARAASASTASASSDSSSQAAAPAATRAPKSGAADDTAIIAALRAASLPALAQALPASLRKQAQTMIESTNMEDRAVAGNRIAGDPAAMEFILAWLTREHELKEMQYTVMNIYAYAHFAADPRTPAVMRHLIATSKEPELVAEAAKQWRAIAVRGIFDAVNDRVLASRGTDPAVADSLAPIEDWARNLRAGTNLPTFLRRPVPLFATKFTGDRLRMVAFGDFGTGSKGQLDVAAEIRTRHQAAPFELGITLGDNFYPRGLSTLDDPRWKTQFEDLYGPLGITFHPSLGNHDRMYDADSAAAEILYTRPGGVWQMPGSFYTYTAGPAQFFAIDTVELSDVQLAWLGQALDASTARWKIVYGHYPIVIASPDYLKNDDDRADMMRRRLASLSGDQRKLLERTLSGEQPDMYDRLLPVLKGRADVYLAGHHHSLEHLKPVDGVNLFIIGGGGATSYPVEEQHPRALFAKSLHGFADITVTTKAFTLEFVDQQGKSIYAATIDK